MHRDRAAATGGLMFIRLWPVPIALGLIMAQG